LNHNNSKGHKKKLKDLLDEVGTAEERKGMFEKSELEKITNHLKPTEAPSSINKKKKKSKKNQTFSKAQRESDDDSEDENNEGDNNNSSESEE